MERVLRAVPESVARVVQFLLKAFKILCSLSQHLYRSHKSKTVSMLKTTLTTPAPRTLRGTNNNRLEVKSFVVPTYNLRQQEKREDAESCEATARGYMMQRPYT